MLNRVIALGILGLSFVVTSQAKADTNIDFQPNTSRTTTGYIKDSGLGYSSSRGYGWIRLHYNQPINISSTARERNQLSDQRLDTFLQMQYYQGPAAYWEHNLSNGRYQISVGVGDSQDLNSVHSVRAEGVPVVSNFVPTTANPTKIGTLTVDITDGRLTLDSFGGRNTKIGYVRITPVSSSFTTPYKGNLQAYTADQNVISDRLMFSTITGLSDRPAKTLTLSNGGRGNLRITSLTIDNSIEIYNGGRSVDYQRKDDFVIVNRPSLPLTLAPGKTLQLQVKFAPKRVATNGGSSSVVDIINGENYARLNIAVSGAKFPLKSIALAGINLPEAEGGNEPSVQQLARIFGWKINIGTEKQSLTGVKTAIGDEILSPYFLRNDAARAVELWPLGVMAGRKNNPHNRVRYEAKSTQGLSGIIYEFAGRNNDDNVPGSNDYTGGENQKILPKIYKSNANQYPVSSLVSFYPNSAFAINTDGAWTDDNKNGPGRLHNARAFPVKDAYGNVTSNIYMLVFDPGNTEGGAKNYDYQDAMFLIKNVRPE